MNFDDKNMNEQKLRFKKVWYSLHLRYQCKKLHENLWSHDVYGKLLSSSTSSNTMSRNCKIREEKKKINFTVVGCNITQKLLHRLFIPFFEQIQLLYKIFIIPLIVNLHIFYIFYSIDGTILYYSCCTYF